MLESRSFSVDRVWAEAKWLSACRGAVAQLVEQASFKKVPGLGAARQKTDVGSNHASAKGGRKINPNIAICF